MRPKLAIDNFESVILYRGTYWANYATGLGASIHELGHCFDLAHTPKGIMGRGFDDMNSVFTMWRHPPPSEKDIAEIAETGKSKHFWITCTKGTCACQSILSIHKLNQHLNQCLSNIQLTLMDTSSTVGR